MTSGETQPDRPSEIPVTAGTECPMARSARVPVLTVLDLAVCYPVERAGLPRLARAVDGVSFDVLPGEALGLVGESGCGKTTIALSILGLVAPPGRITRGRITFGGRDLTRLGDDELRRIRGAGIGMVFQEPMMALNPVFTVGDQVAEALMVHQPLSRAEAVRQAIRLLDAVRVPDAATRAGYYPHELSGGLRQRVLIAAALACRPSLLIADEPTTALDVTTQAGILDLLRDMRREFDLSLLLITHDFGVVSELTDRVAVMYAGRIVESGPTSAVLGAPLHPYTKGLLASLPGLAPGTRLRTIPGTLPDPTVVLPGCPFAPRCDRREDRCDQECPDLTVVDGGRRVRCLLCQGGH
jgi:peptide/nickel transport system ATP-binding protein